MEEYPVMYLVRDLRNNTLFTSKSEELSRNWAKRYNENRPKAAKRDNPLSIVKSQLLYFID